MDPWTRPLFDILGEFYVQKDIDAMLHSGVIEISPLAFMRGRTFKQAFVIADEMQNSSPNQMMMLATRLGEESKMVITGDLKQSDRMENNGLLDLMKRIQWAKVDGNGDSNGISLVEFDSQDIQRSAVVSKILKLYEDKRVTDINNKVVDKKNDCALVPDDPLLTNKPRLVISGWYKGAGL
jgi:phosphate starvation-inducible PhoH-like protein